MKERFGLDRLLEYGVAEMGPGVILTNPKYRQIKNLISKLSSQLKTRQAAMYKINENKDESFQNKKDKKEIDGISSELPNLKLQKAETNQYIHYSELPEEYKSQDLPTEKKLIADIVKMICYRSETWLSSLIRTHMSSPAEPGDLLKEIFNTSADITVDRDNKTLIVSVP